MTEFGFESMVAILLICPALLVATASTGKTGIKRIPS